MDSLFNFSSRKLIQQQQQNDECDAGQSKNVVMHPYNSITELAKIQKKW